MARSTKSKSFAGMSKLEAAESVWRELVKGREQGENIAATRARLGLPDNVGTKTLRRVLRDHDKASLIRARKSPAKATAKKSAAKPKTTNRRKRQPAKAA